MLPSGRRYRSRRSLTPKASVCVLRSHSRHTYAAPIAFQRSTQPLVVSGLLRSEVARLARLARLATSDHQTDRQRSLDGGRPQFPKESSESQAHGRRMYKSQVAHEPVPRITMWCSVAGSPLGQRKIHEQCVNAVFVQVRVLEPLRLPDFTLAIRHFQFPDVHSGMAVHPAEAFIRLPSQNPPKLHPSIPLDSEQARRRPSVAADARSGRSRQSPPPARRRSRPALPATLAAR